ncbi:MAG: hypothetical protein U1E33_03075 [Rhodospirillales bacterium]
MKGILKNSFGRRLVGGTAAVLVCAVATAPAFAAGKAKTSQFCASDTDIAALNARVLQTELMVAALSCDERLRYNNFITSYQSVLTSRSQALQGMFKRAHGAQGTNRMNAFITKMANDSSQGVREKGGDYCAFAGELFDEVLTSNPTELNRVTNKPWIEGRHGYRPCVLEASRKQAG